ncbi:MAG: hypothetical protein QG608_1294, partial [Actinomycetota bacterium]|nr:hypothetical protein [Actinomycetota bacterium]
AGGSITRAFDVLGRQYSYTDADGATTTTRLDVLDRPVQVSDSVPSTVSYEYDVAVEPRGLVTKVTDSVAGAFTARYDADGDLAVQGLPGGYTLRQVQDPAGEILSRVYARDADGTVVLSDTVAVNVHGQVASHTGTPGVTASQEYAYDRAGRLTGVADTSARAVCTRRAYGFDKNSNRTSLTTATGVTGGDCPTTGGATASSVYDTADRLIADGHVYDAFGRATQIPGSTLTYHANDLARSQTAGDRRQTWDLDTAGRYRSWTVDANTTGTWTRTASKTNHYDGDSDSPRWIVENTSTGALTRNVEGPDGDLAATTTATGGTILYLSTIHGDTPLQLPLDDPTATTVIDTDEYGNVTAGTPARYAWLGAKQRSTETLTGLTLMGVRLYHPDTGRFLSVDPVPGGNPNAYTYPVDPLNTFDLDGRFSFRKAFRKAARAASYMPGVVGTVANVGWAAYYVSRGNWREAGLSALGGASFGVTRYTSLVGRVAQRSRFFGKSSRLFGRGKKGFFNRNDRVRLGWTWKGSHHSGRNMFSLRAGSRRSKIRVFGRRFHLHYAIMRGVV